MHIRTYRGLLKHLGLLGIERLDLGHVHLPHPQKKMLMFLASSTV